MSEHTARLYEWFAKERGINRATLDTFGVTIEGQEITLPYKVGAKIRKVHEDGRREFYSSKGLQPSLFHPTTIVGSDVAFLCEGETDTMRLHQELGGNTAVFGIPGINTWNVDMAAQLQPFNQVFVVLDNDPDYSVAAQVDGVYKSIRQELGSRARRIRLPQGVKDVCDFFSVYDLDTLRAIAERRSKSQSRYKPLDFSKPPPAPNWLLDGMIAKGDVTLFSGREGLGKSWFTQGLAVAVAEGWETYLGIPLHLGGCNVLYVDQENPDDDIYRRLHALGIDKAIKEGSIRYLWNEGIRLDRNAEDLLEEALDFEPALLVIDSLTRVHTQDENNAGAMAALFNDGIQPLARETGAAVVLIHHDNKGNEPRGSVDITASPDNVLHVRSLGEQNPSKFSIVQGKTRRRKRGEELIVEIVDQPHGKIELKANAKVIPPF